MYATHTEPYNYQIYRKTLYMCVCVCVCALSCVQLFVTPWTVTCQTPLFMGFSKQDYWSGLPFPLQINKYLGNNK